MNTFLAVLLILCLNCSLPTAFVCTPNSQYYVECTTLSTFNDSNKFCSQYEMTLLNLTNSTTVSPNINQVLTAINCTKNFWYTLNDGTRLLGNVGSLTGGVLCTAVPLLGLYCVSTSATYAATICYRTQQLNIQQRCVDTDLNQRYDLIKMKYSLTLMYASVYQVIRVNSQSQCNALCSNVNHCLGVTYQNYNCTLYI